MMKTMNLMGSLFSKHLSTKKLTDLKLEEVKESSPVT
jgi:hypothetical protein